jgi:hypothetical protein
MVKSFELIFSDNTHALSALKDIAGVTIATSYGLIAAVKLISKSSLVAIIIQALVLALAPVRALARTLVPVHNQALASKWSTVPAVDTPTPSALLVVMGRSLMYSSFARTLVAPAALATAMVLTHRKSGLIKAVERLSAC